MYYRNGDNLDLVPGACSCRPLRIHNTSEFMETYLQENPTPGNETFISGRFVFHIMILRLSLMQANLIFKSQAMVSWN